MSGVDSLEFSTNGENGNQFHYERSFRPPIGTKQAPIIILGKKKWGEIVY